MEVLPGENLQTIVREAVSDLLAMRRRSESGPVKSVLLAMDDVNLRIALLVQDIDKKKRELAQVREQMQRIREGDWSSLPELEPQHRRVHLPDVDDSHYYSSRYMELVEISREL